eukprot:g31075.t1
MAYSWLLLLLTHSGLALESCDDGLEDALLSMLQTTVTLDRTKRDLTLKDQVYNVHIPKSAGSSFALDAQEILRPLHLISQEGCLSLHQSNPQLKGAITMLRDPRAHVLSQYKMCPQPVGLRVPHGRAAERRLGVTAPLRELGGRLGTAPGRVLARRFYPEQRAEWCHHGAEDSRIARHLPGGAWQRVEHGPGSLEVAICLLVMSSPFLQVKAWGEPPYSVDRGTRLRMEDWPQLDGGGTVWHFTKVPFQRLVLSRVGVWGGFTSWIELCYSTERRQRRQRDGLRILLVLKEIDALTATDRFLYDFAWRRFVRDCDMVFQQSGKQILCNEALRCLSDAQNIYRDLQLWSCHYAVELHMARLYLESERPHEAASIAEEALVLIQDLGDLHSEYLAYGLLCCAILDDESTGDRRLRAEGRAKEAERFKIQGKRPHALALSLLAGVLGETSSTLEARTKDMDLEAHLLLRLSSLLASENDDETLKALEGVIALCQRLPEKAELIASARYLSVSLLLRMFDPMDRVRKDLSEAKESLALARELFRDASDPRGEVLALSTLAEMHQAENEIPEALEPLNSRIANLQRAENVKLSARTAREGLRIAKHAKMLEGQVQLLMQCVQ